MIFRVIRVQSQIWPNCSRQSGSFCNRKREKGKERPVVASRRVNAVVDAALAASASAMVAPMSTAMSNSIFLSSTNR